LKSSLKYIFILLVTVFASNALACHQGDFESTVKGHHQWGKNVGFFQITENTTITSSTSTSCDYYTAFLESQYNYLQEQVAHGIGPHLDALAMINGCGTHVRLEFSRTLRANYIVLFRYDRNPQTLRGGIENLIDSNSLLKMSCRKV